MKATIYKPSTNMTWSVNTASTGFGTYNQSGITFNESGYAYGGADRRSSVGPENKLAKITKPNNNTSSFITPH